MKWHVRIGKDPSTFNENAIYILLETQQGMNTLNKEGIISPLKQGEKIEPALLLPDEALEAFLLALIERGVKSPEESYTEGVLEATKGHLEDMRRLVFNKEAKQ